MHATSDIHPVVRTSAVLHDQFEALHPFTDGNGRIGRLLAILQLIESSILGEPLINLSPYFESRLPSKHRHLLREVSATGDYARWVEFFCEALGAQAHEAESRIRELLVWRDETLVSLRSRRLRGVVLDVAADLIGRPSLNVKAVAEAYGVSNQAANTAVARLVDAGVLEEVTGSNYNRVFQAPAVLDIFFRGVVGARGTPVSRHMARVPDLPCRA